MQIIMVIEYFLTYNNNRSLKLDLFYKIYKNTLFFSQNAIKINRFTLYR